ncbi:MAG: PPOX class F420-dependent oxidoreductase [Thermomicrobiales bacterium]
MTRKEALTFLREGTRTGKLATTRSDGRPHVAPVWFVLDGEDIMFNTGASSAKGKSLARDNRAMLSVDLEVFPYSFVLVEGTVTLSEDPDELRYWATKIAERYVPAAKAQAYGERNGVPGEYIVRLTPTKIIGEADVAL